jgi:hypothetical protein
VLLALQGDAHVLQHREVRKDRGDLERAHHAAARDDVGPLRGDVAAVEVDRSAGRGQEAREQVEDRRLARAVGTDQRMDGVAAHAQVDAVDRHEALELLGQVASLQDEADGGAAHRPGHVVLRAMPMLPPAPLMLSITTGCPTDSCTRGPINLAMASSGPARGNGAMNLIALFGQISWVQAAPQRPSVAARAGAAPMNTPRWIACGFGLRWCR